MVVFTVLCATDEIRAFWRVCLFVGVFFIIIFGWNALYYSTDNGSLTQPGFLGTYEDPIQDVTV